MRILVTGSRNWTDEQAIRDALLPYTRRQDVVLVHGGARGADDIADAYARKWGWEIEEHPAPWRDMGRRAGFVRNQHMVDLGADICLAFILNGSHGATDCATRAREAGIETREFIR